MKPVGSDGRLAEQIIVRLRDLDRYRFADYVSELQHAIQTATRAERAGADEEMVVAALLHDIGKVFGDQNHGRIAAALIEPHLRPEVVEVVRHHQAFTAEHRHPELRGKASPRLQFTGECWFEAAARFVDEWDVPSVDPSYPAQPLEHFVPLVERLIAGT